MQATEIAYDVDGKQYRGFLALPPGEERAAGVLLCHEGGGLEDHVRDRACSLAEAGYVAFALDYYGDAKPAPGDVMAAVTALRADAERTRALAAAGLRVLAGHERTDADRLAAIGFCFGGTMAIELARSGAPLRAVVGFHSGLVTTRPEDSRNISGRVLACIGAADPLITRDERAAWEDEMTAGGVDWAMEVYGGTVHSFTNPRAATSGVAQYHEASARHSWASMHRLFAETLTT